MIRSAILAILLLLPVETSAQRIFTNGFEGGLPGGPPVNPCADPLVRPAGWQMVQKSWVQAWSAYNAYKPNGNPGPGIKAVWPNSVSFPTPIGALKGQYLVVPFTPQANQAIGIFWDPAQARPQNGYTPARPAISMLVRISECAGDLRPIVGWDSCARIENTASIFWTTKANATASQCKLTAGKTYFMTVAPVNPNDGLKLGEHTCANTAPLGCDVQAIHRP